MSSPVIIHRLLSSCLLVVAITLRATTVRAAGELTMWTTSPDAVIGSSCEYANSASTVFGDTPWLDAYVNTGMYCAVSDDLYDDGVGCGDCYLIEYDAADPNTQGTTTSGSAIVQVVESGAGGSKHFDCYVDAYRTITGTDTGIYEIGPVGSYARVDCDTTGPLAVIMDGNNAYYVKVLFAGGTNGVADATVRLGSGSSAKSFPMSKVSGATWSAGLDGTANEVVEFDVTFANGDTATIANDCFGGAWPVQTGSVCYSPDDDNNGDGGGGGSSDDSNNGGGGSSDDGNNGGGGSSDDGLGSSDDGVSGDDVISQITVVLNALVAVLSQLVSLLQMFFG